MAEQDPRLSSMKAQVYKDSREKEYFDKFHQRARTHEPNWVYEVTRVLTVLWGLIAFRMRGYHSERVPNEGAVILAPNHASFMDHFFVGAFIRRRVRFMAKSQLFKPPGQWVFSPGGVFPVRRGAFDEDAFITTYSILERRGALVMYCEGGRSRDGKVSDRARPGIGRIALQSGSPIVPIAVYGSVRVRNWKKLQFPKVLVLYGEPLQWDRIEKPTREQQQEVADAVLTEIKALYAQLEQLGPKGVAQRVRQERRAATA
ncbi:1-acyl-sn-glycerol-3-phosphate acyltransferase [Conexibacter sp. CPCC 206217]|uniref:lysophospholipid acyltransferase family protein n=1 Tax=Conexibacter sp. CPCC 206217 TaxID=3064574 RepID=UPI0027285A9E|nr:lysophospholipid acyltransferase family protein [Conexibacter sp. CPCC 206217]MDO8209457.1 lysophospholipid acyltransferase family protein [Conexibacter sp. CPCC 206217]